MYACNLFSYKLKIPLLKRHKKDLTSDRGLSEKGQTSRSDVSGKGRASLIEVGPLRGKPNLSKRGLSLNKRDWASLRKAKASGREILASQRKTWITQKEPGACQREAKKLPQNKYVSYRATPSIF